MKTKTFFSFVLTALLLIGCQSRNHVEEQLAIIDTLLIHDKVDSAKIMLEKIQLTDLKSQEDSAYYYLVQTETNYRNRIPLETDQGINYSQKFY